MLKDDAYFLDRRVFTIHWSDKVIDTWDRIKKAALESKLQSASPTNNGSIFASQIAAIVEYIEVQRKSGLSDSSILNHVYGTLRATLHIRIPL